MAILEIRKLPNSACLWRVEYPGIAASGTAASEHDAVAKCVTRLTGESLDMGRNYGHDFLYSTIIELRQIAFGYWTWGDLKSNVHGTASSMTEAARLALESYFASNSQPAQQTGQANLSSEFYAFQANSSFTLASGRGQTYSSGGKIVLVTPDANQADPAIEEVMDWKDMQAVFDFMAESFPSGWTIENGRVEGIKPFKRKRKPNTKKVVQKARQSGMTIDKNGITFKFPKPPEPDEVFLDPESGRF